MRIAFRSDVGRIRLVNEDRAWANVQDNHYGIAIVADGMGGHLAGEVASQLAVDTFQEVLASTKIAELAPEERHTFIRKAILQANDVVYDMASRNDQYHNMGTTVVALLAYPDSGVIGHIGDSRAYIWTGGTFTQLTEDHTLVNELTKHGQISAEEAANHPRRNVLTRALGTDEEVEVDVIDFAWKPDDVLLLCSDGLSNMVTDEQMQAVIQAQDMDIDSKTEKLLEMALQAGGDDNITVVLLHHAVDTEQEG
ncbi:protein phosphatase [Paenibacillus phyllosphaerae]|uniref:Protein phosphatase n=1 Tax=Paenibacillus phyllosphaerae TaxID=274593 RepID=A0A7W5AX87_9BACL|nr:Stp1/IreP family PP2C-type Ser/Thr phosphatase [Paenibacillus phyllosphaerae]MBB3110465.1 protein phosphatase [Paenibacillus phyllosphaerae]